MQLEGRHAERLAEVDRVVILGVGDDLHPRILAADVVGQLGPDGPGQLQPGVPIPVGMVRHDDVLDAPNLELHGVGAGLAHGVDDLVRQTSDRLRASRPCRR